MSKNNSSAARADVLTFYEKLPFNDNESPEEAAELIKKVNNVKYIYPNENDLYYAENVLEIGCGTGWLSNSIAYYYGSKVTAVDFNPVAIETAKKLQINWKLMLILSAQICLIFNVNKRIS